MKEHGEPAMANTVEVLRSLNDLVSACTKCPFDPSKDRRVANGSGHDTRIMFVSDAPPPKDNGHDRMNGFDKLCEDARKRAGLEDAYHTYLIKCRFGDALPTALGFAKCIDFFRQETEVLRPQVIVTSGSHVRINDGGKVHSLDFPNLIREFLNIETTVTWTHDPVDVLEKRESDPELMETFYKQYADISAMLR